jgi:hypothetical protein
MKKFDEAAVALGYKSYSDFAIDREVTIETVNRMRDELKKRGISI